MTRNLISDPPGDEEVIVVELSGKAVRDFVFGLTLNRRTFDRNPDGVDVDHALTPVAEAIASAWARG